MQKARTANGLNLAPLVATRVPADTMNARSPHTGHEGHHGLVGGRCGLKKMFFVLKSFFERERRGGGEHRGSPAKAGASKKRTGKNRRGRELGA